MNVIINFAIFIASGLLILKAAELFINGAVEISRTLHLPKIFIGTTIVSLVTVAPELIVSVTCSYIGRTGMAVGNAIGSCICNIGLVLGVGAIISDVVSEKKESSYRMIFLLFALAVVYLFASDGFIGRKDAVCMLILLAIFLSYNYRSAMKHRRRLKSIAEGRERLPVGKGIISFLMGGLLVIIIARYGLIHTGINIAEFFKIPPIVIALTMIALGTSLPELFSVIVSSYKKHGEIALGNVIGSNILNLFLVLGVSALIRPLDIDKQTLAFNMPFAAFITIAMFILGAKNFRYNRRKGIVLLIIYLFYVGALFTIVYR